MALNFSVMSVNERQRKTSGKTIFRFFTTSCDPYMGHTLSLFCTFHLKEDTKDGCGENCLNHE